MGTLSRQGVFSRVLISHIHWEAVMIPIATRAVQLAYRGKHFCFGSKSWPCIISLCSTAEEMEPLWGANGPSKLLAWLSKQRDVVLLMLQLWSFSFNFNGNNQHPIIWVFILASYYFAQRKAFDDRKKNVILYVRSLRRRRLFLQSTLEMIA